MSEWVVPDTMFSQYMDHFSGVMHLIPLQCEIHSLLTLISTMNYIITSGDNIPVGTEPFWKYAQLYKFKKQ